MSANKGLAEHSERSRSTHLVQPAVASYLQSDNQFQLQLPPLPPQPYASLFNRRSAPPSQIEYLDCDQQADHQFQITTDTLGMPELGKMTAQEIMNAKALAASKSHSEAERKRRERINNHLARLRSLLPCTTKTDKASLLAEVIQHLKELKRQTLLIAETIPIPTETDELSVDESKDGDRSFVIRASLCCEDRPDLLPNLIKAVKALRQRILKAEITTICGRVRNVLFVMGEEYRSCSDDYARDQQQRCRYSASSIQEALKAVIGKSGGGAGDESSTGTVKRQRTNTMSSLERRPL